MDVDTPNPSAVPVGGTVSEGDWQRLWYSTLSTGTTSWASLAIVGSGQWTDLAEVAERVAAVVRENGNVRAEVLHAKDLPAPEIAEFVARLHSLTADGARVIVAVDSPVVNPSLIPVVRATSAVLLVVRLGQSTVHADREMVETVERAKVLGSVVLG